MMAPLSARRSSCVCDVLSVVEVVVMGLSLVLGMQEAASAEEITQYSVEEKNLRIEDMKTEYAQREREREAQRMSILRMQQLQ